MLYGKIFLITKAGKKALPNLPEKVKVQKLTEDKGYFQVRNLKTDGIEYISKTVFQDYYKKLDESGAGA